MRTTFADNVVGVDCVLVTRAEAGDVELIVTNGRDLRNTVAQRRDALARLEERLAGEFCCRERAGIQTKKMATCDRHPHRERPQVAWNEKSKTWQLCKQTKHAVTEQIR